MWGTGINPKWQKTIPGNLTIHAVRGLRTLEVLKSKNVVPTEEKETRVSIGDPGTALIHLFPSFQWESNGVPCFVPHHQDQELFEQNQRRSVHLETNIRMISVRDSWRNVVQELSRCSSIASSSLHGLVIADALGIPSRWFQYAGSRTEKTEGWFKYQDYFSTIGRVDAMPLGDIEELLNVENNYWSPPDQSDLSWLIHHIETSFPFDLFEVHNQGT